MSKFLDIDTLNYGIKSLSKMIDITFLKKKELFNVTPESYRLFNSSTDDPSKKLTVIANNITPTIGQVTSDTVRSVTKIPSVYAIGAEVVHIDEVLVPKFDVIKGIGKTDLDTIKADTKDNRQLIYKSNILFIVDDSVIEFYDRDKDSFTEICSKDGKISEWDINTEYKLGKQIIYNNKIYKCILAHTSTSDFKNDINNWKLIVGSESYEMNFTDKKDINVQHNLNCAKPLIQVYDLNDNELYLDVEYYSDNLVILHSSEVPISGKVIVTRI